MNKLRKQLDENVFDNLDHPDKIDLFIKAIWRINMYIFLKFKLSFTNKKYLYVLYGRNYSK